MSRQPLTPSRPDREFPDATDVAIIRALQADGRLPFVRVAELAGVSERTVRRKFHRMVADGALRVVAVANPLTMGFTCPAIMGIQCELTRVEEVVRALCALRQLRFVSLTTGRHDILVEGYFPTHDDLYAFRSGVLHRIDGVVSSQVAIVLRIDKQIYLWNLQRDDS
ncbi:MAG TPA: Lrp/AsnC family transcriptional regulator, partial [Bacillota bacterium]